MQRWRRYDFPPLYCEAGKASFGCLWLCMSCLLDRDLGNSSYTVYLAMIWGQSVGFKQRAETPADGEASLSEMTVCFQFHIPADFRRIAAPRGYYWHRGPRQTLRACVCRCVCARADGLVFPIIETTTFGIIGAYKKGHTSGAGCSVLLDELFKGRRDIHLENIEDFDA